MSDQTAPEFLTRAAAAFDNEPAPLAVGINGQIVALLEGVHSPRNVGIFLGWWTRRPDYLETVARGEPRRDLDGIVVQETEPGHREHAKERLNGWRHVAKPRRPRQHDCPAPSPGRAVRQR